MQYEKTSSFQYKLLAIYFFLFVIPLQFYIINSSSELLHMDNNDKMRKEMLKNDMSHADLCLNIGSFAIIPFLCVEII